MRPRSAIVSINKAMAAWRQGDVCLDPNLEFFHLADLEVPHSEASLAAARGLPRAPRSIEIVAASVLGFVVTSQSCDIVRDCESRPFVEVAPVIRVSEEDYALVGAWKKPAFAAIPALRNERIVADLDRAMTVEKAVVARWTRIHGCPSGDDARDFATQLAGRKNRAALPDDFVKAVAKLQDRIKSKHGKATSEGSHLVALREIRVRAMPSWEARSVTTEWWFFREDEPVGYDPDWKAQIAAWLKLIDRSGRFREAYGTVVRLDDITARDYVESDRLDLDRLSVG